MLAQTQYIKNALIEAGYRRDEISVRTPSKNGYYQDPIIIISANKQRQLDLAKEVSKNGFLVTIPIINGEKFYPHYNYVGMNMGRLIYQTL